jgi:HEAT repeat protein
MKRNLLLVLITLFGALAVGALLLLSGGGAGGVRAEGSDRGKRIATEPRAGTGLAGGTTGRQDVTRAGAARIAAKTPAAAVQPGLREPFDSEETLRARERNASRIEELVQGMINPDLRFDQRTALAEELQRLLREMGHRVSPAVRQRLLEMLATAAPSWKDAVAGALGSLKGDTGTAQALLEMLKSTPDDLQTRRAIYSALGQMSVPEVTPQLMALLGQGLADEPLVIRTIGSLASPDELEQLFARLDGPLVAASRTEIENVLRDRARTKDLLDKVAAALDDANPQKKRSLLKILAASSDPAHAARVRDLLATETDAESRALAIQALGKYGDVESGKVLLDLVQTGTQQDQGRAIQAIHTIHDRDTIGMLAEGYARFGPEARHAVMGAISRVPAPTEAMVKLAQEQGLVDNDLRVRNAAARTLGKRGRDESVEPLVAFLERSTHPAERSAAFAALETIHTNKAALAAIRALRVVHNTQQRDRLEEKFKRIAEETAEK